MKTKSLMSAVLSLFCTVTLAQTTFKNLTFSPAYIQPGQEISITYDPAGTALSTADEVEAMAFLLNQERDSKTQQVFLKRNKGKLTGVIKTLPETKAVSLYFLADEKKDNNDKNGYFILLHDKGKNPIAGAMASKASFFNTYGAYLMDIESDKEYLLKIFEEDITTNPEIKRQYINTYLDLLAGVKKNDAKPLILKELNALASLNDLTEVEYSTLLSWYMHYEQNEKYKEQKALLKAKFPKSETFQMELSHSIYQEQDLKNKLERLDSFATAFPESPNLPRLYSSSIRALLQNDDIIGIEAFLNKFPDAATAQNFNQIAWNLAEKDTALAIAAKYAAKAIEMAREDINSPKNPDVNVTINENKRMAEGFLGQVLDTYGYILFKEGKYNEAVAHLKQAVDLLKKDIDINSRYVSALLKNGSHQEVLSIAEGFIATGLSNEQIKTDYKEAWVKVKGSEDGYEAKLAQLRLKAQGNLKAELKEKMIALPAPDIKLNDLKGNTVSLADLKGKIIVVDFWATWCGPCIQSFPAMQKAIDKYKDDQSVKFLFINSWERGEEKQQKVSDFVTKKQLTFDVLMDLDNSVIGTYKVKGIPTKYIIDQQGVIRFQAVGFSGNEDMTVEELSLMIEMSKEASVAVK